MKNVNLYSSKISTYVTHLLIKEILSTFLLKLKKNLLKGKKELQKAGVLLKGNHFQPNAYISLIKDPLWKRVCTEIVTMMGPLSVLKIWKCKLGLFSSQEKIIDIECPTEEAVQFVQQYAFIIRGCLQQYFPSLKEIRSVLLSTEKTLL